MSRLLLVDDDQELTSLWRLLLERAGHQVETASSRGEALARLASDAPDILLMDLGLPLPQDGEKLLAEARRIAPGMRIIVLTGAPEWLSGAVVPDLVQSKPIRLERLLEALARLAIVLLCFGAPAAVKHIAFSVDQRAEVMAELEMSSPGSDWGAAGREAAVAAVTLDGRVTQHIMLWAGEQRRRYPVFFGSLDPGKHSIDIARHHGFSAAGSKLEVHQAAFRQALPNDPYHDVLAHAPVLYARADTVGKFNDAPLLMYCERRGPLLEYTVVFSNEDGGTATRALMARWGRTTDIEYLYRHWLDSGRSTIQAKDHKELAFTGRREGAHPVLLVATQNNMIPSDRTTPILQ
jgi:CheY-like chemotaxis protein